MIEHGHFMQTVTSNLVFPGRLSEDQIQIEDIAHALSRQCRFAGHLQSHYSTAQHSVLVCDAVQPKVKLHALLHDAHEAYMSDIVSPVLWTFLDLAREYKKVTKLFDNIIFEKWNVDLFPELVHLADQQVLSTEARDLMGVDAVEEWGLDVGPLRTRIFAWDFRRARSEFLDRFYFLVENRDAE